MRNATLAYVSLAYNFPSRLRCDPLLPATEVCAIRNKEHVAAGIFEAYLCAARLDAGYAKTYKFIENFFSPMAELVYEDLKGTSEYKMPADVQYAILKSLAPSKVVANTLAQPQPSHSASPPGKSSEQAILPSPNLNMLSSCDKPKPFVLVTLRSGASLVAMGYFEVAKRLTARRLQKQRRRELAKAKADAKACVQGTRAAETPGRQEIPPI